MARQHEHLTQDEILYGNRPTQTGVTAAMRREKRFSKSRARAPSSNPQATRGRLLMITLNALLLVGVSLFAMLKGSERLLSGEPIMLGVMAALIFCGAALYQSWRQQKQKP